MKTSFLSFLIPFLFLLMTSCQKDPVISDPDGNLPPLKENYQVLLEKSYGGIHDEFGYEILALDDKELLLMATSYENGNANSDILLIRIDEDGNQIWKKTFGSETHDHSIDMVKTQEGKVILMSTSWDEGPVVQLIKIDLDGNLEWQKTIPGRTENIIPTLDGGLAFIDITDYPPDFEDYYLYFADVELVKVNSNGGVAWKKDIAHINIFNNMNFIQKSNGQFLFLCAVFDENIPTGKKSLISLSEEGEILDTNVLDLDHIGTYSIMLESGNDEVILLASGKTENNVRALKFYRFDATGSLLYSTSKEGQIYVRKLIRVENDYLIVGTQYESQTAPQEIFISKLTASDQFVDLNFDQTLRAGYAFSAIGHQNGQLSIIGYTKEFGHGYYDVYYLKLKPE